MSLPLFWWKKWALSLKPWVTSATVWSTASAADPLSRTFSAPSIPQLGFPGDPICE